MKNALSSGCMSGKRGDEKDRDERGSWPLRAFPTVVRYCGLAIAIYETVDEKTDRPALLALAGSMMLGSLAAEAWMRGNGK